MDGPPPHLLIVRAPYYRDVVDGLTAGASASCARRARRLKLLDVAGAFELPQALRHGVARAGGGSTGMSRWDAWCAVRPIITSTYAARRSAGLMRVALQFGLAMGQGVLTVHRIDQALARSGRDGHNKGAEAAAARCCCRSPRARRHAVECAVLIGESA